MSFFSDFKSPVFNNGSFTSANSVINTVNNVNNYHHSPIPGQQRELAVSRFCRDSQSRFRTILGDLILLREVSSDVFSVPQSSAALSKFRTTNPFRLRLEKNRIVARVIKKVHTAEIVGFESRKFTVITFDSENGGEAMDGSEENKAWKRAFDVSSSERLKRANHFPQLFALSQSNTPSFIYHDELVGGDDIRYHFRDTPIIASYLHYIFQAAYFSVASDDVVKKMSITLSPYARKWFFNLKKGSFQFDLTSPIAESNEHSDGNEEFIPDRFITRRLNILCPDIGSELSSGQVVRRLGQMLSGYLRSLSALGEAKRVESLEKFTRHGLLTFGAVVDVNKDEILGHFPLTPMPHWFCKSSNSDFTVQYPPDSKSVLLVIANPAVEERDLELEIHFGLTLPSEASERLRLAFLCQSHNYYSECPDPERQLVLFEELHFVLRGKFPRPHPKVPVMPGYLLIPTWSATWINGMPCLRWPTLTPPFYWSSYHDGRTQIPADWCTSAGAGIFPELKVETWVGTCWPDGHYQAVQEYLSLESYDPYQAEQFARDNQYEIILSGDPHLRWGQIQTDSPPQFLDLEQPGLVPREMESYKTFYSLIAWRRVSMRTRPRP